MMECPEDVDADPFGSFLRGKPVLFGGCRKMAVYIYILYIIYLVWWTSFIISYRNKRSFNHVS